MNGSLTHALRNDSEKVRITNGTEATTPTTLTHSPTWGTQPQCSLIRAAAAAPTRRSAQPQEALRRETERTRE